VTDWRLRQRPVEHRLISVLAGILPADSLPVDSLSDSLPANGLPANSLLASKPTGYESTG
jgi:hypothetical protein